MNKVQLIQSLKSAIDSGVITKDELLQSIGPVSGDQGAPDILKVKHLSVNKILYVLGVAIIMIGIVIFVARIWDDLGSFGRVFVTLGTGLMFAFIGTYFQKTRAGNNIAEAFHAIGGLLVPGGAMVTLNELSTNQPHPWAVPITLTLVYLFYMILNYIKNNVVLTVFCVANATAIIYTSINAMLSGSYYNGDSIYAYVTIVIGLSYIMLGWQFREGWNARLSSSMYFLGSLGVLGASFSRIFDSTGWQLLYLVVVVACLYLSVLVRSRGILITSTLFLIAYVSYITGKYFADSLGWPISLIILGMLFIGMGYLSININRKYISS